MGLFDKKKFQFFAGEALNILLFSGIIYIVGLIFRLMSWLSFKLAFLGSTAESELVLRILGYLHFGWAVGSMIFLIVASFKKLVILLRVTSDVET